MKSIRSILCKLQPEQRETIATQTNQMGLRISI